MSIRMKFGENIAMKHKVTSCFVVLYIICTANADHAHRVVSFKNISEQRILWRQTYSTKVECVAACFRIQKCLCVQFSLNGSCLGLEVKFVKNDTTGDRATPEHFYVTDKGMTYGKESSIRSRTTSPRNQTKGMTNGKESSIRSQTTSPRSQTKAPPCGDPPSYPEAVVEDVYTIGDGRGVEAVYACTPLYKSCTETLTRRCFTGKWETEEVKCDNTMWMVPGGVYENRFKENIPCGPTNDTLVEVSGTITGRRMRCFFMRNADILFYMSNEKKVDGSSVNIYSAKLRGRWKGKITRPGIFPRGRRFSFELTLEDGVYSVVVNRMILHEFAEVEKGAKPSSFRIQYDIDIDYVKFGM